MNVLVAHFWHFNAFEHRFALTFDSKNLKNWLENVWRRRRRLFDENIRSSGPGVSIKIFVSMNGPGMSIKIFVLSIFLIAHFWHFNAFEHQFDCLKYILTSSLTLRLALWWAITSFCILIFTFRKSTEKRCCSRQLRSSPHFYLFGQLQTSQTWGQLYSNTSPYKVSLYLSFPTE